MAEENQNPTETIMDSIMYASPREFSSIVRPSMNDKLGKMKLALLHLISFNNFFWPRLRRPTYSFVYILWAMWFC